MWLPREIRVTGIDAEILAAAAYSIFLLVVAACLEAAARHSHQRSERMRVAGFQYDAQSDLWTCPNNEKLLRAEVDYQSRVVFYRAAGHACNRCPIKDRCTDSMEGRVIERRPDSWLDSELRRFHRGISVALAALSSVILTAELIRYPAQNDRALTGTLLLLVLICGFRLASKMSATPRT
jgi:hypothetical protein